MAIEKILNKRSNAVVTDGGGVETPKKPTSSQLDNGEIAVNYHKGMERLFMKNDNDEVVEFVSKDEVDKKQDKVDGVNIVRKEFEDDYGPYTEGVVEVDNGVYNAMLRKDEIVFSYGSDKGGIFFEPIAHTIDGKYFPAGIKCKHKKTDDPLENDLRIARMCDLPSQVQSDWNESDNTKKSFINNKPTIPTKTSELNNDSGFLTEHQDISGKADKNEANIFTQKNTFPDIALSEEYALDYAECNIGDTLTTAYGDELTFKNNNTNNSVQLYNNVNNFAINFANIEGVSNCIEISVPGNGELSFTGSNTAKLMQWMSAADRYSVFVVENNGTVIWSEDFSSGESSTHAGYIMSFMNGSRSVNVQSGTVKIYFSNLYDTIADKGWMWYISNISFSSTISSVKQAVNSKVDIVSLSPVATSGSYNDLSDTPSIPANIVEQITINNNTITPTSGIVDLGTVLTTTTSSATSGSTTPITSGGVYTTLQSYLTTSSANSTYEKKLSFTSVSSTLPSTCVVNTYYRITSSKTSLAITLPSSSLTAGDTIGISFTAGTSITTPTVSGGTIYKQDGWSTFFEANATYEIVALYDGGKWLVTSTKFNS